jgi:Kef-type K+ transport system membrane component KefB
VLLGIVLGTSVLRIINEPVLTRSEPISTVALGIIAFMIGIELRLDVLRRLGRAIFFIVVLEVLMAFALTWGAVFLFTGGNGALSLLLAAVASATAPAATVAVIQQYRAKGTLTSTILAVVGIDDAVALTLYVFVASFVRAGLSGAELRLAQVGLQALASVGISIALGAVTAVVFHFSLHRYRENEWIGVGIAAAILLLVGLSEATGSSELLSIMVFAAGIANRSRALSRRSMEVLRTSSPVFLAAFFVFGGAHLDVGSIATVGLLGLVYFFARGIGKMGGAGLGALLGGAPKSIRGRIGFALLPQVGVALALALSVRKDFARPEFGQQGVELATVVVNVLLLTTVLTEIVGPILTRHVLSASGETREAEGQTE